MRPGLILACWFAIPIAPCCFAAAEAEQREEAKPPRQTIIKISPQTTRITEPLTDDGYPDYIGALNKELSRGVTKENNAAVLLAKGLGPAEIQQNMRDEFYKRLGMETLPEDGQYFKNFRTYAKQVFGEDEEAMSAALDDYDNVREAPWTEKDHPHVARWLEQNKDQLELIVQASKRSRCYWPLIAPEDDEQASLLLTVLLPMTSAPRDCARGLTTRAMLRAGSGEAIAAWEDLLACFRLARHSGNGGTLIEALVGAAIESIAWEGLVALVEHQQLTAEQIEQIRKDLAAIPERASILAKIDTGERYMFLDCTCGIARVGPKLLGELGVGVADPAMMKLQDEILKKSVDWNVVLRMGNHFYDQMVASGKFEDPDERREAYEKFETDLKNIAKATKKGLLGAPLLMLGGEKGREMFSRQVGGILISLLLPALQAVVQVEYRTETQLRLADLALALGAYRHDHGDYPDQLDALSPKYVKQIPVDAFAKAEFHYEPKAKGYLLYSYGDNQQDDGARSRSDDPAGDDIVIRMGLHEKKE